MDTWDSALLDFTAARVTLHQQVTKTRPEPEPGLIWISNSERTLVPARTDVTSQITDQR